VNAVTFDLRHRAAHTGVLRELNGEIGDVRLACVGARADQCLAAGPERFRRGPCNPKLADGFHSRGSRCAESKRRGRFFRRELCDLAAGE